ncbi:ClpP/crotonase-like domain-containing protein [Halteromyces radiatus]|uniref:ClpP/crotonase-like domain-containing protein n=1 Tax=Halteromyces radiatus TaxID=101107 RepID=UPI002220A80F|nr:ClpP/crotonase-like domain-containing protein [Halteromyces radiatus]KAI8092637.1 ClpP/crotonase-like domain-containing protein [Halteromyces radiatus]
MSNKPTLETIDITVFPNGVAELAFNRPNRYNSLTPQAYKDWLVAIQWAANEESVKVCVLTGRGKYYTSGQELTLPDPEEEDLAEKFAQRHLTTKTLVKEMIQFPKLLIGAINGHCIGFGTTTAALCDVVYSVPDATFATPFMKLGFCAEGCSSVLFPRIMGSSKANEMLLLGRRFSAKEMEECGFLRILPAEGFQEHVLKLAGQASEFSVEAMKVTKELVRGVDRDLLLKTNEIEMERLMERMGSADSFESISKFVEESRRKKAAKKKQGAL